MYRLLALIVLILIVALQYMLWRGAGGWTQEQALKQQVEEQRSENARLKQRNAALEAEVEDLKAGQAAVEERARSEMGMVKPGETFYRVVEPADPKTNVRPEDVPEDAASPASPVASSPASDAQATHASGSKAADAAASDRHSPNAAASPAVPAARSKKK
jgi:cell division protein FtsB